MNRWLKTLLILTVVGAAGTITKIKTEAVAYQCNVCGCGCVRSGAACPDIVCTTDEIFTCMPNDAGGCDKVAGATETPVPCQQEPACLHTFPRCLPPVPAGGWCPTVTPGATETPVASITPPANQAVVAEIGCGDSGSQAIVSVDKTIEDVWMVVEDMSSGVKVIYGYAHYAMGVIFGPNINGGSLGSIRTGPGYGEKINVVEGGEYLISVYTAAFTTSIPTNWQKKGEIKVALPKCGLPKCNTCQSGVPSFSEGNTVGSDGKCDNVVDMFDFLVWKDEYLQYVSNPIKRSTYRADFDCDQMVTINDFVKWKDGYLKYAK